MKVTELLSLEFIFSIESMGLASDSELLVELTSGLVESFL